MSPSLDIIWVHHYSGEDLGRSVASVRAELERNQMDGVLWVVDHGSTTEESAGFELLGLKVLRPDSNRGFAAGVNHGVAAGIAPLVLVLNPDVILQKGCLSALLEAVNKGASVAGPRFFLDQNGSVFMPPLTRTSFVDRWLNERKDLRRIRRRNRRHSQCHWEASTLLTSRYLPGAALLFPRSTWETHGGMDEGYFMYFEETEWLERIQREGGVPVLVPDAHAIHRYGGSTPDAEKSARYFANSWRRFSRRGLYQWVQPFLEKAAALIPAPPFSEPQPWDATQPFPLPGACCWVEIGLNVGGVPAAGIKVSSEEKAWQMSPEVLECLSPGTYFLRTITLNEKETDAYVFTV